MTTPTPAPRSLRDRTCPGPRIPISQRTLPRVRTDAPTTAVDVRSALERAVASVPDLDGRVTIICEDVAAWVDVDVVEQVLVHLLHLEAAIPDHRVVWVSAVPAAGGVVLTVEDDAPWVTDDPALRRGGSGAGSATLQLARVASLARTHGGACWVEPAVDEGVCYVVDLPGRLP